MDKERLVEIIRTGTITEAQLEELGELAQTYPWFGLPRFLRLKAFEQMGTSPGTMELNRAVLFSSDRKHLYKWVTGAVDSMIGTSGSGSTELEFLDDDVEEIQEEGTGHEPGETEGDTDPFVLMDEDVGHPGDEETRGEEGTAGDEDGEVEDVAGTALDADATGNAGTTLDEGGEDEDVVGDEDDADARPIPEKDESEMEEPELEEPEAIPVMDPLDDEDDEDDAEGTDQDRRVKNESDLTQENKVSEGETSGDRIEGQVISTGNMAETSDPSAGERAGNSTEVSGTGPGGENGDTAKRSGPTGWSGQPGGDPTGNSGDTGNGRQYARTNPSAELIERFLEQEPGVIRADQQTNLEGDVSAGSVKEDDGLITDTLAKIYVKQGLHAKAIYAYERLSLKYPEKSAYFAAQIEKIKNNANV